MTLQAAVAASDGFLQIPDLYINLANVSLASQEYTDAIRLYRVALAKLDSSKQSQVGGERRGEQGGLGGTDGGERANTWSGVESRAREDSTMTRVICGTTSSALSHFQLGSRLLVTPLLQNYACCHCYHLQVLLYLARGYYDSDDLRGSKQCLLRAIHIAPTDYRLRFNAALTMQV